MHVDEVDDLLGTAARLVIVATLADGARWTFTELRDETGLADGNLHVQTGKLVDGELAAQHKVRRGGRTVTCFELTKKGRLVFGTHVRRLRATLSAGATVLPEPGQRRGELGRRSDPSRVW